jgi:hypothetical protein
MGSAVRPAWRAAFVSSIHTLEAERLVERLGELCSAPATIVWDRGLRDRRGLLGFTRATMLRTDEIAALHVDPDQDRLGLIDTAAHEFVHSLEQRRLIPERIRANSRGGRCSQLARPVALAITAAAAYGSGRPTRTELATILWTLAGVMPSALGASARKVAS